MTQAKQDVVGGALGLSLGLCLLVWLIPDWVEADADLRLPVDLVPRVVAICLVACGALMMLRGLLAWHRRARPDAAGFARGEPGSLAIMILVLLVGTFGFEQLHFLVVAPVIVAAAMWVFGPVRPLSLLLTATLGPVLIWVLATQLLGRVLP